LRAFSSRDTPVLWCLVLIYVGRLPKHDIGSVDGIVQKYLRQKAAMGMDAAAVSAGKGTNTLRPSKKKK
jgi:hypothetical protein